MPVTLETMAPVVSNDKPVRSANPRNDRGNNGKKAMVLAATCPWTTGGWLGQPYCAARMNQRLSHRSISPDRLLCENTVAMAMAPTVTTRDTR